MIFSEIINGYKERYQLTHEDISKKFGVSKVTVSNWITGKNAPDLKDSEIINAVAIKVGVSPKDIVLSIIEQNGVDFTVPEMPVNPYYKYFGTKFTDSLTLSETETMIFLLIADKDCGYNMSQYNKQSHLTNEDTEGYTNARSRCTSDYEQNSYNLMVEQYIMNVLSSHYTEPDIGQALKTIHKIIGLKNKLNSATLAFINNYLKSGHKSFDTKRLTDKELYDFLDSFNTYNLTFWRNSIKYNLRNESALIESPSKNFECKCKISQGYYNDVTVSIKPEEICDFALYADREIQTQDFVSFCYSKAEKYGIKNGEELKKELWKFITDNKISLGYLSAIKKYGVRFVKYDDTEVETYKRLYADYEKEMDIYNSKMEEIRKLQYLYDKEKYPDLPAPVPPEKPSEKYYYVLSKKGRKLLEFYDAAHPNTESLPQDKADNYRYTLEKHIGTEVMLDVVYAKAEDDEVLLRDVYLDDDYVSDHLHIFKGIEFFKEEEIGNRFNVKGVVYEYTNSKGLKNLGIEVTGLTL